MTWPAQVLHILHKDVRQGRWVVLAYLGVLLIATAITVNLPPSRAGFELIPTVVLRVLGTLALAFSVQSDSPIRSNAFWASKPFRPSSMVAAKLLLALVVLVGPGLAAQWVALEAHGVAARDLPFHLIRSATVYGFLLLGGAVVAAFTRDLRSFMLVGLLTPLALFLLPLSVITQRDAGALGALVIAGGAVGGVALLARVYRTRDARWIMRAAGGLVVLCVFMSMTFSSQVRDPLSLEAPPELRQGRLAVRLRSYSAQPGHQLALDLRFIEPPTTHRLVVTDPWVTLILRDGTSRRVRIDGAASPWSALVVSPAPVLGPSLHWLGGTPGRLGPPSERLSGIQLSLELDNEQRRAVAKFGIRSATFEARVGLLKPEVLGKAPLVREAALGSSGHRIRIAAVNEPIDEPLVELSISTLIPNRAAPAVEHFVGDRHAMSYALVHEARGEALWLESRGAGSRSSMLPMPGTAVISGQQELGLPRNVPVEGIPMNIDWYRASHLAVVSWVPVGGYVVRAEVGLP